jgi:hypothetical protein
MPFDMSFKWIPRHLKQLVKDRPWPGVILKNNPLIQRLSQQAPFKQKPPLLFTLGAAALLVGGGGIAYWSLSKGLPGREAVPAGLQFVPQDALLTLSLTTQESQWNRLRQFGTPDTQKTLDNLILQWRDRLLTVNGYRFKQDIKPWIGDEITLAFLSPDTDPVNLPTPAEADLAAGVQAVLIVPISDPLKAKALIADPQEDSVRWQARDYKGVAVQSTTTATGTPLEIAVLGTNWLAIANTPEAVEQVIDSYKGAASIVDTPGYRQALQRLQGASAFAQVYVNLLSAREALIPASSGPLVGSQGLAASVNLESDGLHFQGTSWLTPDSDSSYANLQNGAREMPRRFPAETLMLVSGGNLHQLWQSLSQSADQATLLPFRPDTLKAGFQASTGLTLEQDLLPWMKGEFALGLLPPVPRDNEDPNAPLETARLLMMVQVSDRTAAEATWKQLDEVVKSRYRYQVEETVLADQPVTQWISPFQGIQMSHGWLEGNVAFWGIGASIPDAIAPRPRPSLMESSLFQSLTANAPRPNNGNFFIDLQKINALQGSLPVPQLTPGNQAITAVIQALGVTAAIYDERSILYDLHLKLAKNARTGLLPAPELPTPAAPPDAKDTDN